MDLGLVMRRGLGFSNETWSKELRILYLGIGKQSLKSISIAKVII